MVSIINVNTADGLVLALKGARAGDTIQLAPGTYEGLQFKGLSFSSNVTIQSQNPDVPAILNNFEISNSKGLQFNNLELAAKGANYESFIVSKSQNIGFDNVSVHGSMDNNPQNDGQGIGVRDSSNIQITNSEFQQLQRGISVSRSSDVVITGNDLHDLRTTGFVAAEVVGIKIAGNSFSNFKPMVNDHPDAIQFLTSGTTTISKNIVISDNVISRGTGDATQGIFLRDQVGNLAYENVTITNNLVVGTGYGGIYVIGAKNLVVSGNELVSNPGKENATWVLIKNVAGAVVADNESIWINYDNVTNLSQAGNTQNVPVLDFGKAVLDAWLSSSGGAEAKPPVVGPEAPSEVPSIEVPSIELPHGPTGLVITGDVGSNYLLGTVGADTISDGGGSDTMIGGAGNDVYYTNNFQKMEPDLIVEKPGEGIDTVYSTASYTLTANVENLTFLVKGGFTGTGNELDNKIIGNVGDNILNGMAGNDTIDGGAGNDQIGGGAGDDVLAGGLGNDNFFFERGSGRDVVTDFGANGDHDTIDISSYLRAGLKPILTDAGSDVVISFKTGESITLVGVDLHDLTATSKGFIA
ncbi:MAG: right-handed parallel beta-helix repeat-containing protein [Phenylobacterium sp.]|nr:right-handed parallel beta-helix repeat-containing protein [Phenylobacterium sp.]